MIIDNRDKVIEALAGHFAAHDCAEAEMDGYGWDADNPADVDHFRANARKRAIRTINIIEKADKP